MVYDVIIVGAGATGLIAARRLAEANKNILILEARERVGGRAYTLLPPGFSQPVEAGAEFVHGKLPVTLSLLQEAGIAYTEMEGRSYTVRNGRLLDDEDFGLDWSTLMKKLHALQGDMSLQEFVDQYLQAEEHAELKKSVLQFAQGFDAADPAKVSVQSLKEEWSQDNDDNQFRISGGYSVLMNWLADECRSKGTTILLNQPVTSIDHQHETATVSTGAKEYHSKKVLITIPLGLWQQRRIQFQPVLNEKEQAAKLMGYGNVMKINVGCNERFWETNKPGPMPGAAFIFSDAEFPTWWTQNPDPSPMLTGWLAGPPSDAMNHLAEDQLRSKVLQSLAYIFGLSEENIDKKITGIIINNWHQDPYALGGYSYETIYSREARKVLMQPVKERLYFAGEALYEGSHTGTVEAAFVSGIHAAETILRSL